MGKKGKKYQVFPFTDDDGYIFHYKFLKILFWTRKRNFILGLSVINLYKFINEKRKHCTANRIFTGKLHWLNLLKALLDKFVRTLFQYNNTKSYKLYRTETLRFDNANSIQKKLPYK